MSQKTWYCRYWRRSTRPGDQLGGQDNHYTDPLTNMQLSAHGYAAMNALLNPHIAVLEGGYSIRGALPYVNLGICLALAGLPFEHVHEPDHDAKALKQRPQVTEYIRASVTMF